MKWTYYNPVRVSYGRGSVARRLPELVGTRAAVLITTPGFARRGTADMIKDSLGDRLVHVAACVEPNPTIASIHKCVCQIESADFDVLIALGGGSVIDTAKTAAVRAEPEWLDRHLRHGEAKPDCLTAKPVIAVPTTSGTGSEVTPWATVWDETTGQKYSISDRCLYPRDAILDPELTDSMPLDISLFSALDALSHACESVWNVNANPVSDAMAERAGSAIVSVLTDSFLKKYRDPAARDRLHTASFMAGLAFSATGTALAHSISYPFTGKFGLAHGAACAFTLAEVLKFNAELFPDRMLPVLGMFGSGSVDQTVSRLYKIFSEVELDRWVSRIVPDAERALADGLSLITPARALNNIRPATQSDAARLVRSAFDRL